MTQLHYNSSAVACIGGTRVDIQYTTAVRVHVPGTYILYRTYFAITDTAAAVAVL